jgi:transposase
LSTGGNAAAKRLGIPQSTMTNWVRQSREGASAPVPGAAAVVKRPVSELEAENARLRRELASAKLDLEIVKKAAVGSTIQRNTFVLMLHFREGGMYGSNGTPWSFRFSKVGALATLEGWRIA